MSINALNGPLPAAPIQTEISPGALVQPPWAGWLNLLRQALVNAQSSGGAVQGSTLQPFVQSAPISLVAVATTAAVNFSGSSGALAMIGIEISTGLGAGAITAFIDIIADGVTFSIPIYSAAGTFNNIALTLATSQSGTGANVGDRAAFQMPVTFVSTLIIQLRITATTLASGAAIITVMWGHN